MTDDAGNDPFSTICHHGNKTCQGGKTYSGKKFLTSNGKEITFVSVLHHMGIRGNLAADSAAKRALNADR